MTNDICVTKYIISFPSLGSVGLVMFGCHLNERKCLVVETVPFGVNLLYYYFLSVSIEYFGILLNTNTHSWDSYNMNAACQRQ